MTQIDNRSSERPAPPISDGPRLRFAPSPTGFMHIGVFRTALFSWLYARHTGGKFILRIEDTDTTRSVEGALENLLEGLEWLGMDVDEGPVIGGPYGPYFQLQRKALYLHYADQLLKSGHAYRCYCTRERLDRVRQDQQAQKLPPRYDRHCRYLSAEERAANDAAGLPFTVRFAMPLDGETAVPDPLHGDMVFKNSDLDDMIILKSNGLPPYHLAHLVDDHLMGITHVLRGEDWIPSAPLHVQIYKALGWEPPLLYHVPNVLEKSKKKLSKRRGAPSWSDYAQQGYLPEAVFNFLALLGWSYDDKTEIFTKEELIKAFSLDRVGVASGIYDPEKLLWMNGLYIRKLSLDELTQRTLPYLERPEAEGGLPDSVQRPLDVEYTKRVLTLEQERLKTLGEAAERVSFFFLKDLTYETSLLIQKGMDAPRTHEALVQARDLLNSLSAWQHDAMEQPVRDLAAQMGLKAGQMLGSLRAAVSGSPATPPLFAMMEVLGREVCMQRITEAIARLAP
ncbi:MAG: glutamate--tRNA ligase [Ktedonobacteraceae bacterium]|nr:glutamate--tRNA ligase [Ktedonobacteraceae bacterium]